MTVGLHRVGHWRYATGAAVAVIVWMGAIALLWAPSAKASHKLSFDGLTFRCNNCESPSSPAQITIKLTRHGKQLGTAKLVCRWAKGTCSNLKFKLNGGTIKAWSHRSHHDAHWRARKNAYHGPISDGTGRFAGATGTVAVRGGRIDIPGDSYRVIVTLH